MTPKEKSKELYDTFITILGKDCVYTVEMYYKACLCAIEVCERIKSEHDMLKTSGSMNSLSAEMFWDEVMIDLHNRKDTMPRIKRCECGNTRYVW